MQWIVINSSVYPIDNIRKVMGVIDVFSYMVDDCLGRLVILRLHVGSVPLHAATVGLLYMILSGLSCPHIFT